MKLKNLTSIALVLMMVFALAGSASAATINLSGGDSISLGSSNVVVSGTCTGSTLSVPIVVTQGSASTQVAAATTPDNGPATNFIGFGNFALNIDDGFTTGAATLTAVCPEGNSSVSINLVDPDPATNTNTGNTNNNTGSNTGNNNAGDVGGTNEGTTSGSTNNTSGGSTGGTAGGVSTTPEGGVAAGKAGLGAIELTVLAAILMGVSAWLFTRKTEAVDYTV